MTHEENRCDLSDVAKIYTTLGFSKASRANKDLDSQKKLFVNKHVVRDGIQATAGIQTDSYSYVVIPTDDRVAVDFLAFLINSSPWKVMLGDGNRFLEGQTIPTSLGGLKKLPVVIVSEEEQGACAFLDTVIKTMYDVEKKEDNDVDNVKKAYRYLAAIRDYIALEILLDGVLSNPDISVLSGWIEKKATFDNTKDRKEAIMSLFMSIFSSNDELRDRMNKMRLYIDQNADAIFNKFPK